MNSFSPVFEASFVDKHEDEWNNATVRFADYEVFALTGTKYTAQADDTYREESHTNVADSGEVQAPVKAMYSVEFWSTIDKKAKGLPSRAFSQDGEHVFEVDFKDHEVMAQWESAPDNYYDSLYSVFRWHFNNKVIKKAGI